jgi:catechol 2,3-dioxygenase-like lactoylglutathione lyase family enzyme
MADTNEDIGDLHLATVVINVQDMHRAVDFWTAALGYVRREQEWDPEFMMLVDPAARRLPVSLQLASSPPKEPVRVHLDLYTREQARHIERLTGLGAERVDEWPYPDGADFVVMRDPDGNEFCVIDHPEL